MVFFCKFHVIVCVTIALTNSSAASTIETNSQSNFMEKVMSIIANPPSKTTEKFKQFLTREFIRQANICLRRLKSCSKQLSPEFCASPTQNIAFYVWAREMALNIMGGAEDGQTKVKCSPLFIKAALLHKQ